MTDGWVTGRRESQENDDCHHQNAVCKGIRQEREEAAEGKMTLKGSALPHTAVTLRSVNISSLLKQVVVRSVMVVYIL